MDLVEKKTKKKWTFQQQTTKCVVNLALLSHHAAQQPPLDPLHGNSHVWTIVNFNTIFSVRWLLMYQYHMICYGTFYC